LLNDFKGKDGECPKYKKKKFLWEKVDFLLRDFPTIVKGF